ncbi:MAG: DUF4340 domain-containing protein [Clostridia bacterium]|nr:DUF4340 domain-containing protein [Clostridia bacterium]
MADKQSKEITAPEKQEASGRSGSEKEGARKKFRLSELWNNKRTRSIVIALGVAILAGIAYLVLSLTVLKPDAEVEQPTVGPHGESMVNGKPFVVEPIESASITGIRVDNAFGGFYYYKGEDDQFYFEGAEKMLYDQTSDWMQADYEDLSDLMASVSMIDGLYGISRYLLASTEVVGYDPDNLAAYGLDNGGQATLTVTYLDEKGEEQKNVVHFGFETVSGGSYYVMPECREAMYVVSDSTISRCIFTGIESYFTPLVAPMVSNAVSPNVEEISLDKKGDPFFAMRRLSDEEYEESGQIFTHILTYPNEYYPSSENMDTMLSKLANFTGERVVEFNVADKLADPALHDEVTRLFRLYSLMDERGQFASKLSYRYAYEQTVFDTTLYISEKLEEAAADGEDPTYIYYIYSPDFDVIVEFDAQDLPWMEWGLLDFIDNHAYATTIDNVANITMSWGDAVARFDLTGEGKDLKISSPAVQGIDTDNFRQLYKAILFTTMEGYAEEPEDGSLLLTINITLRDGTKHEYNYYGMTARKAYYSLDGSGEFYINRDYVKQMIAACQGILNGEKVVVDRRN